MQFLLFLLTVLFCLFIAFETKVVGMACGDANYNRLVRLSYFNCNSSKKMQHKEGLYGIVFVL
ncbi:hypothetical protein [Bartonella gliris]|uniref:hypothetical protein n=1 Tax=Bartonella gliris TaxID=3004109 RepID=UPI003872B98E